MQKFTLKISPEDSGKRLDVFLQNFLQAKGISLSRTAVQKLMLEGNIRQQPKGAVKAHYKIKAGEIFTLTFEESLPTQLKPENIPLDIVYEDEDIAVINKPVGLVVHPAPGNREHTLVNALLYHFKNLSDVNHGRPGVVHRLDKDTSGLLLIAKSNFAHLSLAAQFAKHSVKRKYIAIVSGRVEFDENIIEIPIRRHPLQRKKMSVGYTQGARYAMTRYRTLLRQDDFSVLELEPFTGRTHQLRVHLSFINHPILGDSKYAKQSGFKRLYLHAKSIGFMHPVKEKYVEFHSEMPEEFKQLISSK